MIRLVVNADDLGLHPSIDEGILRAHREGIVTSASLLSTGSNAAEAVRAAKAQGLAVGVHLCLSTALPCAAPLEKVSSVAPGGVFRAKWKDVVVAYASGVLRQKEVALELAAQVARARELGAPVDHLDAHQHLHVLPGVRATVEDLAARVGLPLRWPRERPTFKWLRNPGAAAKSLVLSGLGWVPTRSRVQRLPARGIFEAGTLDLSALVSLLETLPEGDHEIGCHPGAATVHVPEDPEWTYGWTRELEALTHPRAREVLARRGIQLTTYGALAAA